MKAIDLSKFTKSVMKSVPNVSFGFKDPKYWISTGNFALNFRVSGDFFKGFPLDNKLILLAGESGSGKSYVASGNVVKWCQDNNILPVIIDTENALDEEWMRNFGIKTDEFIIKVSMSLLDNIAKFMSEFLEQYKETYKDVEYEEKQPVLFIIDSLGMTTTPLDVEQFDKGDMRGSMGQKQKQIYSICRNFLGSCSNEPIGMICTQHTYASQSIFQPEDVIAGGTGTIYASSVVIAMQKAKLKEDENGNKTTDVKGIKVNAVVRKTRYTQPFQKVSFTIPWDTGMNPYSGLFELFSENLKANDEFILTKTGNQYTYKNPNNGEEVFKKFRKNITNQDYDTMMMDYKLWFDKNNTSEKFEELDESEEE